MERYSLSRLSVPYQQRITLQKGETNGYYIRLPIQTVRQLFCHPSERRLTMFLVLSPSEKSTPDGDRTNESQKILKGAMKIAALTGVLAIVAPIEVVWAALQVFSVVVLFGCLIDKILR